MAGGSYVPKPDTSECVVGSRGERGQGVHLPKTHTVAPLSSLDRHGPRLRGQQLPPALQRECWTRVPSPHACATSCTCAWHWHVWGGAARGAALCMYGCVRIPDTRMHAQACKHACPHAGNQEPVAAQCLPACLPACLPTCLPDLATPSSSPARACARAPTHPSASPPGQCVHMPPPVPTTAHSAAPAKHCSSTLTPCTRPQFEPPSMFKTFTLTLVTLGVFGLPIWVMGYEDYQMSAFLER